jgi:hypothetical protein
MTNNAFIFLREISENKCHFFSRFHKQLKIEIGSTAICSGIRETYLDTTGLSFFLIDVENSLTHQSDSQPIFEGYADVIFELRVQISP